MAEDRDWKQAICPFAFRIEDYLSRHAIQRRLGFSQLRFMFEGLDREDEAATAEIFERRYRTNSIVPDEIRAHYGEQPMES